jgi:hypothetical protein
MGTKCTHVFSHGQVSTYHRNPDRFTMNETPERLVLPSHPVIVSKSFKSHGMVGMLGMPEERQISFM